MEPDVWRVDKATALANGQYEVVLDAPSGATEAPHEFVDARDYTGVVHEAALLREPENVLVLWGTTSFTEGLSSFRGSMERIAAADVVIGIDEEAKRAVLLKHRFQPTPVDLDLQVLGQRAKLDREDVELVLEMGENPYSDRVLTNDGKLVRRVVKVEIVDDPNNPRLVKIHYRGMKVRRALRELEPTPIPTDVPGEEPKELQGEEPDGDGTG